MRNKIFPVVSWSWPRSPPQRTQDTRCHLAVIPNNTQTPDRPDIPRFPTLASDTRHPTKKWLFHMRVKILSCHRGLCRYLCSVILEYLLYVSTTLKLILTKSAYFYIEFVQRKYVVGPRWWAENMSVNSSVGCFSEHAPYPSWHQCCVVMLVQWFYICVLA